MYKKNILRNVFITILFFIISTSIKAQELKIKNVQFEDKGETIVVKYDIEGEPERKYKITLSLAYETGKSLPINAKYLKGDIGKNIKPGTGKEIIWELKNDYTFGLIGDGFVFGVTAESQKFSFGRMPLYIAGTGLVGGIIYFATKSVKQENENSITITIPAEY
jgi:hypothetical protein